MLTGLGPVETGVEGFGPERPVDEMVYDATEPGLGVLGLLLFRTKAVEFPGAIRKDMGTNPLVGTVWLPEYKDPLVGFRAYSTTAPLPVEEFSERM